MDAAMVNALLLFVFNCVVVVYSTSPEIQLNTPIDIQTHSSHGSPGQDNHLEDCRYHLLHFSAANLQKAQSMLSSMRVAYDYLPHNTLNAFMCTSQLAKFPRELLRWNNHLQPQHKVHHHHRALSKTQVQENFPLHLVVLTAPTEMEAVWRSSRKLAPLIEDITRVRVDKYNIEVLPSNMHAVMDILAAQPEVKKVERKQTFATQNNKATSLLQSQRLGPRPIWAKGITGQGSLIHVGDTGLDYDSCFFKDNERVAFYPHNNSKHRKVFCYIEASDDYGGYDHTDPSNAHGTHVSGSAAGKAHNATNQEYNGMAYDAKIVFTDLSAYGQDIFLPADFDLYFRPPWEMGCYVSSNSWGSNEVTKDYVDTDRESDIFQYYTQDFLIVVAAGNTGSSGLLSPGSAKNTLSVGSTYNTAGNTRTVIPGFSARGPTWDKRIKPDCVLPGSSITSARSDGRLNSRNQCTVASKSGTSMSTPLGAGAAILVAEYFEHGWYPSGKKVKSNGFHPAAALVKGMIIHGSVSTGGPVPGSKQGYGLVRMDTAVWFSGESSFHLWVLNNATVLHHGEWTKCFEVQTGAQVKITMVFMDAIADPTTTMSMVNDLDLSVLTDTRLYRGNGGTGNWDNNNLVEQITFKATDDNFRIHVYGAHVPVAFPKGQPFSMVITAKGIKPSSNCPKKCANCDKGTCKNGRCQCQNEFHHVTCSKCDPDKLCSGHGECLCTSHTACQSSKRCRCDRHFIKEDCSQCEQGWYGPNCDSDCNCHGHGTCNKSTGICNCVASPTEGYYGSKMCDICARNWAGRNCNEKAYWCDNYANITITDKSGIIEVTGEHVYTTNMKCGWIIKGGSGSTITITFKWIDTETDYDPVWVFYTTNPDYHKPDAYITGKANNKRYTSRTGVMFVAFESDITNVATGFQASFTVSGSGRHFGKDESKLDQEGESAVLETKIKEAATNEDTTQEEEESLSATPEGDAVPVTFASCTLPGVGAISLQQPTYGSVHMTGDLTGLKPNTTYELQLHEDPSCGVPTTTSSSTLGTFVATEDGTASVAMFDNNMELTGDDTVIGNNFAVVNTNDKLTIACCAIVQRGGNPAGNDGLSLAAIIGVPAALVTVFVGIFVVVKFLQHKGIRKNQEVTELVPTAGLEAARGVNSRGYENVQ